MKRAVSDCGMKSRSIYDDGTELAPGGGEMMMNPLLTAITIFEGVVWDGCRD